MAGWTSDGTHVSYDGQLGSVQLPRWTETDRDGTETDRNGSKNGMHNQNGGNSVFVLLNILLFWRRLGWVDLIIFQYLVNLTFIWGPAVNTIPFPHLTTAIRNRKFARSRSVDRPQNRGEVIRKPPRVTIKDDQCASSSKSLLPWVR